MNNPMGITLAKGIKELVKKYREGAFRNVVVRKHMTHPHPFQLE